METTITLRITKEDKRLFNKLARDRGLNLSSLIRYELIKLNKQ